jgi:hypothetical protein
LPVTTCPADVVAAPVDRVWDILMRPTGYGAWADVRIISVTPDGAPRPGQVIVGRSSALGLWFDVRFTIEAVDPIKHQLAFRTDLPLGIVAHNIITAVPLDAGRCRVAYG